MRFPWLRYGWLVAALGFLWFSLIRQLDVEWTVNPQYNYGWTVPVLCAYLFHKRWLDRPDPLPSQVGVVVGVGALMVALLLFPTRLLQEANPDWRLVSWLYAGEVLGLTLVVVRACFGVRGLVHFAFPISFMLVAVPWPTVWEHPLIQGLTQANALMTVEFLNQFGMPALQHGNVIEVSSGVVGIDEACSGIRSFQANLMIALFLGELYRLKLGSRLALVAAGFGLAFLFNVVRTVTLSIVAAKRGMAAISQWHDPAGGSILAACFVCVWLLALLLRRWNPISLVGATPATSEPGSRFGGLPEVRAAGFWGVLLMLWVVGVELGNACWYRSRESSLPKSQTWSIRLPRTATDFRDLPMSEKALQYLRYDEAQNASWRENGMLWRMIFLRWDSGRTAATLARSHTPDICIAAAGREAHALADLRWVSVKDLKLPFRTFEVQESGETLYVFYCLWEDREHGQSAKGEPLSTAKRWQVVLEHRRNLGQRSLEVVIGGAGSLDRAEVALQDGLARILSSP